MGRGFVFWAIAAVKDRETTRWQADHGYRPDMTITLDVVQKWLAGPLHKEAASLKGGNKALPAAAPSPDRSKGPIAKADSTSDSSWHAGVDLDHALALAREIWTTQGACIEHDPGTILASHGAPCLRVVLAILKGGLRRKFGYRGWKAPFDSVFGFGSGKRVSVGLPQYLQNISRQHKDHFAPRAGRAQFGAMDVDDDAEALKEGGCRLDIE